ncbi:ssDNA-binding domain-containing protein (plasmid) [Skermanella rosea]|uniref:ArdC family protein n=1 Tax=Skermanella rosea TaxID=1817965 RepID=UPI0019315D2F|nr:zincin-like metallopeptidase domain-containing protein [Skermanella rosea]UEM07993.1 ssDNA-binding domain-containing protein [Skermanella rosea]
MTSTRKDIYDTITASIIAQLEQGSRPWMKPWNAEHAAGRITRPLRHDGTPYRGINVLMLWASADEKGYSAPIWMTYRQAADLGGQVRKGEKSSIVAYADQIKRTEENEKGEEKERKIPFLKQYNVFNVEQIDGLPDRFYALAEAPKLDAIDRIEAAETFFRNTGAQIDHGGNQAFYAIQADRIQMPPFMTFRDPESYYATLGHETTHWTRHPSRLNRDFGRKRWGDEGYAAEELVAEIGSAFLAADLGLAIEPREDHAAYLDSWLKVLKGDKHAIFTASSHAQKAADYLHGLQPVIAPQQVEAKSGFAERERQRREREPVARGR